MNKRLITALVCAALMTAPLCAVSAFAQDNAEDTATLQQQQTQENEYEQLPDGALKLIKWNEVGSEIAIPENVTAIGAYAIDSKASLVTIPKSVTAIEKYAVGYTAPEEEGGEPVKAQGLIIACYEGSEAQKYAEENGFEVKLHEHSYTSVSKKEATCTEDGEEVFECECGDKYTVTAAKLGHSLTRVGTVAPTLTAKGYSIYICTRCNQQIYDDYTDALLNISKATVTSVNASYTYTGSAIKPVPVVKYGSTTLKSGTDYTVTYTSNTAKGTAKLTIKGKGKYGGSKTVSYKITTASITKATVSGFGSYKKYTGKARTQSVTLKFNGKTLKNGTDYTITYKNNIKRGTAQMIIKGKGNFSGTLTKKFKIVRMGWFKYKGNYYYYSNKGVKYVSGEFKIGDYYYYFAKSGVRQTGWQKVGSTYRLYDRTSGKKVFNKTVDGVKINKKGNAVLDDWSKKKIATMIKAHKIMLQVTSATDSMETKRLKCFNWVLSFPYHQYRQLRPIYRQKGWEMTFANDIFDNHQGCCVAESAAVAFLFREIGYTDVYVAHDSSHSWVTVGKYLFDPVFAEAKSFSKNYNVLPYDYRVNPVDKRFIG